MNVWRATALCGAFVLMDAPAFAQIDPPVVIQLEQEANSRCRGGRGDDTKTWQACGERNAYRIVLHRLGWCFGQLGQAGYQMTWHRCEANSYRPQ